MFSFLYGPVLTSVHDYWKNHNSDYMDLYCQRLLFTLIHGHSRFLCGILYCLGLHFHHLTHLQLRVISALAQPFHSFWIFLFFCSSILDTFWPGEGGSHLLVSHIFAFSYSSQASHGKNTRVVSPFPSLVDHVLSELFTMTHPFWVALQEWLIASLSYASPFITTRLWSMVVV